ncbi:MAG: Hsp70 family protein, partial [Candidatus Bathyarchaeia archaeon]
LNVTAKDMATGKEAKITITGSTRLSKEEKERMIREAERFAEQDRKAREEAETRNAADSLIYTAERTLKELGDKVDKESKDRVEKGAQELRELLAKKADIGQIKAKMDELSKHLQEIGARLYQRAAEERGRQQQPPKEGKDRAVDADYKVEGEEKK